MGLLDSLSKFCLPCSLSPSTAVDKVYKDRYLRCTGDDDVGIAGMKAEAAPRVATTAVRENVVRMVISLVEVCPIQRRGGRDHHDG
jgi:hypothetical protein